ncbi:CpaD family pilus assembly protein [Brevundimonas diminuta]|jgi:pilus assembly protein CpaD|uniref:CpaD family pilus assembly protein n=1 Tax=Brevundimonas diminuta TaxID=293 RepID=UPI0022AFE1D7|nr:CpaD family pilus assembly protein [Brevundimonas diminuta]MCZ4106833.1 CpaD family pilus assembly protein [Brevundimonas diminuta]
MIRTVSVSAAVLSLSLALSACVGGPASLGGEPPLTPTSRFSLQVEPGLDRIALAVHETGLSANQRAALDALVGRFAMEGAPVLVIEAPAGGDPVAAQAAWNVKAAFEAAGVPGERIQLVGYAAPDPRAPVLVGFETVRAVVPQCGTQWGNLGRTGDNQSASNFGCAVTANLAAQIADPRDIVAPRAMIPADSGRRSVVFDAYRKGEQTSAQRETLLSQTKISQAVQ